jgi:hypothetical protein
MSTNLDKLMQMATLEQLNNLIQQMSKQSAPVPVPVSHCDAKDVLSLPIVQKVIIAYEDELKLNKSSNNCSCDELIPTILEKLDNHSLKLQLIENRLNDLFALLENKESKQEELMVDKNQPKLTSFPGFGLSQKQEDEDCLELQQSCLESPCLESPCLESQQSCLESQQESLESQQSCLESLCLEKENITLNIEETEPENNNIDIIEDFDEDIQESTDTDTNTDTDVVDQVQIEDVKENEAVEEDEEVEEDESVEVDESVEENEEDEEAAEDAVAIEDEKVEVDEEADTDDSTEDEVATNEDQDQVQTVEEEEEEEEQVQTVEEDVEEEEEEDSEEVFEIEIDDVTYFATDEENGILYEVDKDGEVGKKVGIIKDGEPIFS